MIVMVMERVPVGLRGELTRWLLELKAGVFVGKVSGAVRDALWDKVCKEAKDGGCIILYNTDNEQGFSLKLYGTTARLVEDFEGLSLLRVPGG